MEKGTALQWSSDNSLIHVLEAGTTPRILTVDSTYLEKTGAIYLAHQALDFSLKENEFGTREMVYVATNTGHISVYGAMEIPEGYGESGSDLDGDNIPDTYDVDDDGDSIIDSLDNNCQSVTQVCSKSPEISTIRNIDINVNSTSFILRDTFTLDSETSSVMRNLSRKSLIADAQLSQLEENLFAQSICQNMNKNHFISSWKNVIQLSSGQLVDGHVDCEVESGMTLVAQIDSTTRVAITYVLVFNLSEQLSYPFDFTLKSQPTATDSSLAQHAEMHPIDVTASSTKSLSVYWSPWWVIEGELPLTLEEEIEEEPSFFGKIIGGFIDYPILMLPILAFFVVAILGIIRRKNSIDLDFDEDDEEESKESIAVDEDDEYESEDETIEEVDDESDIAEEESVRRKVRRKPKPEVEIATPVIARRKARNIPDSDGPITKVKRRRLDSGISSQQPTSQPLKASKRKVVTPQKKTKAVKTRKVVKKSEKDE